MRMRLGPLILSLTISASAAAHELLSARDFIHWCAHDRERCEGYARATIDWYVSEIGKPGREFWPFCLREGDDPTKTLIGLVQWFFPARRASDPNADWETMLDWPLGNVAVSILPSAYPCADFDYPPEFADFAAGWMGYDD